MFLPMLPSSNEKSEREVNATPYPEQEHLSGSSFSIILRFANKQSFKVKSVFKSCDYVSNSQTLSKFTTLCGVKGALNFSLILDLFHISFGKTLLFAV